ncbi:hypothetical protein [Desulfosarcina cetonica]|uniref:hypothetical protein n=1 Tax=Desulfosarcina cetonica TaxID=90730 RepID=UPI0006CF781A|nr:hypothetical protein [Desulfosarcina cetonica]
MESLAEKDSKSKGSFFIKYLNAPVQSDQTAIRSLFGDIENTLLYLSEEITGDGGYDGSDEYYEPNLEIPPHMFRFPYLPDLISILVAFEKYANMSKAEAEGRSYLFSPGEIGYDEEMIAYHASRNYRAVHLWFTRLVESLSSGTDPSNDCQGLEYLAQVVNKYPPIRYLNSTKWEWVTIFNPSINFTIGPYGASKVAHDRWLNELLLSFVAYDLFDYGTKIPRF